MRWPRVYHENGDKTQAAALAGEYLAALDGETNIGSAIAFAHIAASTLAARGHGNELAGLPGRYTQPWGAAGRALADGDPAQAAEIRAEHGATAEEAFARLPAGRLHRDIAQAKQSLAFYRSEGASRSVSECEALVATAQRA